MKQIRQTRNVEQIFETDVLVCGGGPAGIGAALQAARMGVKTMIVEMQSCLGAITCQKRN